MVRARKSELFTECCSNRGNKLKIAASWLNLFRGESIVKIWAEPFLLTHSLTDLIGSNNCINVVALFNILHVSVQHCDSGDVP